MGAKRIRTGQYFYKGYTLYSRFSAWTGTNSWDVFEGEHVHWLSPQEPLRNFPTKRDAMRIIDQWKDLK